MTQNAAPYAASVLPAPHRLGDVIEGKYRLDCILGVGGMGVVVGAMHLQLDQRIAIKFMAPPLAEDDATVRRFLQEARAAARIQSEHVARVFDVSALRGGPPYIVMEHLDGEDLQEVLDKRGRLPIPEAIDYVLQAGEAIAEAHLAGIVHRDLKPGNLFCCRRPDGSPLIKVLDFGVSKLMATADMVLRRGVSTGPHVIVGSPLYCSPEQVSASKSVDERADIWALGAILCAFATGKPAFAADSFWELCHQIAHRPLPPLHEVWPDIPAAFGEAVDRSMAKDPGNRFQTVAELADALAPFAARRSMLSIERIASMQRDRSCKGTDTASPVSPWRYYDPLDRTLASARPEHADTTAKSRPSSTAGGRPKATGTRLLLGIGATIVLASIVGAWIALSQPPYAKMDAPTVGTHAIPNRDPVPVLLAPNPTLTPDTNPEVPDRTTIPLPPSSATAAEGVPLKAPPHGPSAPRGATPQRRMPDTSHFGGLE